MDAFKSIVLRVNINNHLGYSNFPFELWMVLHRKDCNGLLGHRSQYLLHINQVYGESFEELDHYKAHDAFHRCLAKLTLDDVKAAIRRAEAITRNNERDGKRCFSTKDTSTTGTIMHFQPTKQ